MKRIIPPSLLGCLSLLLLPVAAFADMDGKLTLQHSTDAQTWNDIEITPEMMDGDGRLSLTGVPNPSFFRLDVTDFAASAVPTPVGFSLIPAGTYARGDHKDEPEEWMERSRPVHDVSVSAFYMAQTPVTYAEWKEVYDWAVAHGYTFDNAGQRGSNSNGGALSDTPENNQHPVTWVNWYDVVKWSNAKSERAGLTPVYYTNDALTTVYRQGRHDVTITQVDWSANGYRLPTEAEWEKAARGGLVGKRWPWGDAEIDGTRANYWNSSATNGTTPVGSYAANGYGLYDMAGNVWEWNWDWFLETWYSQAGASEADTRGPVSGSSRVNRGGSWRFESERCRVASRGRREADYLWGNLGFRLVRTP
jgi:sulfatase modifying factor 1